MIDVFNKDETLTLNEVAERLTVCRLTVRRWQRDGLNVVKCGARTVTTMSEVNAFLNSEKPAKSKKVDATIAEIKNLIK